MKLNSESMPASPIKTPIRSVFRSGDIGAISIELFFVFFRRALDCRAAGFRVVAGVFRAPDDVLGPAFRVERVFVDVFATCPLTSSLYLKSCSDYSIAILIPFSRPGVLIISCHYNNINKLNPKQNLIRFFCE